MNSNKPAPAAKDKTLEQYLEEMNEISRRMESHEQPLDQALKDFEQGMKIVKICREKLNDMEQKISILMQENGQMHEKEFNPN